MNEVCPLDNAPLLKPWTYESLDGRKFKFDGTVSTETHSIPYVARHLAAYVKRKRALEAAAKERAAKKAAKAKEATQSVRSEYSLRDECFERFDLGHKVSTVAKDFAITYGNAHYYYRQWKKGRS